MSDTIALLREIQAVDSEIDSIDREIAQRSADAGTLGEELVKIKSSGDAVRAEMAALEEKKKTSEDGLRTNKERIEKDKKRLNEIKNDKQYKAVTKELSDAERAAKLFEMEVSGFSEKLASKQKELADNEAAQKAKEDAIKADAEETERKKAEWDAAKKEKAEKRNKIAAGIKPVELKRYEAIRSKRAGIGIVAVRKEICQGCNIHIPPQTALELRKKPDEIMMCPHCHRILYIDNSKPEDTQKAAT